MKKSLIGPISVLVIIFSFALWNNYNIQKNTARWSESLQQAVLSVQSENWAAAETALNHSYEDWINAQTYLHIVLEHDIIDDADAMFRRAFAFVEAQDTQELQAELADLIDQLNLLADTERPNLKNIL